MDASAGGPRRRTAADAGLDAKDKGFKKLIETLCNLCMANALQVRALKAITILNYRLMALDSFVVAAREATKGFAAASKDYSGPPSERVSRLGMPHLYVWNCLLKASIQFAKDTGKDARVAALEEYRVAGEALGIIKLLEQVLHVRLCKTYRRETVRLELAFKNGSATQHIFENHVHPSLMENHSADVLHGMAPQGDLERLVQAALDDMGASAVAE